MLLAAHLTAASLAAQAAPKKKVYISVDLEGIAGVVANTQTSPGGQNYEWARRQMIAETNAAIEGAFAGGATEVLVNDSHGPQTNLRPDEIDRRAMLITGQPKPLGMTQGLDSTFDAAVYIGYHAPGSTADAVHGHTFSGALKVVRLNGKEVGEYGLNAMVAGYWGVPVAFISGDKAAVQMASDFIPGVDGLVVKEGIGYFAAKTFGAHYPERLRERFQIDPLPDDPLAILEAIGRKTGCLRSGGRVDLRKAGNHLVHAFRTGKLGRISLERPGPIERVSQEDDDEGPDEV